MNWVSIDSDNGLSPSRRQAIIKTNTGLLSIKNRLQWNWNQNKKLFIHENASENVVCVMATIFSRGKWVKNTSRQPKTNNRLSHLFDDEY